MNELPNVLANLISLDLDAAQAYEAASRQLEHDEEARQAFSSFQADHARHVAELTPLVEDVGGTAPTAHDFMRILTEGRTALGSVHGDEAILKAMRANQDTTNRYYARALDVPGINDEIRAVLERGLTDERRHRAWLDAHLRAYRSAA
jgi:uncharacterized protein (TIGR02284 family)